MEGKVTCNEALEEIDQNIVKVELVKYEDKFDSETLADNLTTPTEEYNTTAFLPKRRGRGRPRKKSLNLTKLQSASSNYSTTEIKLGFAWKDRFRPIQPKPLLPSASPLKYKSMTSTLNMPTLTPNMIVSSKDKTLDNFSETNHCIREDKDDTGSIISTIKECKVNKYANADLNMAINKDLHNCKTSISHKKSIELFFASMAQTVLNLPREVQADIKMQICKIITMAEVKYSCRSKAD